MTQELSNSNAVDAPAVSAGNLARLLRPGRRRIRLAVALVSGLLLSAAFPPLELDLLVWVALVPLLLLAPPVGTGGRMLVGWLFGFAHFATCLAWLNEIGFAAGWLLALVCAVFPMLWYLAATATLDACAQPSADPRAEAGCACPPRFSPAKQCLLVLVLPALWVLFEWVRSWIFTGCPWNLLGVSLWRRLPLLRITMFTGVYGLSFLIVAINVAVALAAARWLRHFRFGEKLGFPWSFLPATVLLIPVLLLSLASSVPGPPAAQLRALVVQGNIPQCRQWTQEDLDLALQVYTSLSESTAGSLPPDLIVWPETAVPAPLRWHKPYADALQKLIRKVPSTYLIGSIDYREIPGKFITDPKTGERRPDYRAFNTAFLLDAKGKLNDSYDKIHLVPFGEYTPFEKFCPWLVKWIGMGRGLTAGSEFTVFNLPGGIAAGVNICYEDVYPEISRGFVCRGANLLITLTNDAWYAESSGSRQHLVHAVFRAVENRRPLLRAGNNSDTCLIMPDGRVVQSLTNPATGNRFYRGARIYEVPVWHDLGRTWYTAHGNVFAHGCALTGLLVCSALFGRWFRRKRTIWAKITGAEDIPGTEPANARTG